MAILSSPSSQTFTLIEELGFDVEEAKRRIMSLAWMDPTPGSSATPSSTLVEIVNLATEISRIRGNEGEHTEDFLLAIGCHPRAIARNVIEEVSDAFFTEFIARVNGVDFSDLTKLRRTLIQKWDCPKPWKHERLRKEPSSPHSATLPPLNSSSYNFSGPTPESNWLIPGRVMCGEVPGGWDGAHSSDLARILSSGVNAFVCLLEFVPSYVDDLRALEHTADFIHFPIDDFSVADDDQTVSFVEELARLIKGSSVVFYIHCFSGRGRTGIVASSLLQALYSCDSAEAIATCNVRKRAGRRGRTRGGEMPETSEQVQQVTDNTTQFKRGGHKGKTRGLND